MKGYLEYIDACMLLDWAISDANSSHVATAEWGQEELGDLEKSLRESGYYYLAEKAANELSALKQQPLVTGVLFSGEPLCINNFPAPTEDTVFLPSKHQEVRAFCPTSNRISVPFWAYRRQQLPGPRRHR